MSRAKRWCFTLNNYTEDEFEGICSWLTANSKYAIVGKEKGAEGTRHLQGYCETIERYRFRNLKAKISERCHLELSKGTGDDNRRYCSKEGDVWEHGVLGRYRRGDGEERGVRRTRDELASEFVLSVESSTVLEGTVKFAGDNPGTWFYSGHNLLRNYFTIASPPARDNICVRWYCGAPGTGKSRRAYEEYPGAYRKDARTKWWHGYMLQVDCVIDDVGPNGIDITRFLVWFDRYPCLVESKGGMLPLHVVNFVVTSNFTPAECFTDNLGAQHPQLPALLRRITVVEF